MVSSFSSPVHRAGRTPRKWSPRKDNSPSRQLQFELERALDQLTIHDVELRKVHAFQRRSFQEDLDARDIARARADLAQIEAATLRHEAVRQEAEAVLDRHLKEQEEERKRKEAEEKARVEREARERIERERKAREEAERQAREEREKRAAEEAKIRKQAEEKAKAEAQVQARAQAEAAAAAERKQQELQARQQHEEKERIDKANAAKEAAAKSQAEAEAAAAAKKPAAAPQRMPSAQLAKLGFHSASPAAETRHNEYLALHKKLKQCRHDFWEQAKSDKAFKNRVGDMRRLIRASVGQQSLTDKNNNKLVTQKVKSTLLEALNQLPGPKVPLNEYLPPHLHVPDNQLTIATLVIYLLSIMSKSIVAAFATECVSDTKAAEALGTMTAQIFSMPELQFARPGHSPEYATLIPILMAKYHKAAPALFGVSGPEDTAAGRDRLGWRTEGPSGSNKSYIHDVKHYERMYALGGGYASIALRNFSKARLRNPYPPTHFWSSISAITTTPPDLVTPSHLLLLRSMLENTAVDRFILFFGSAALAALRTALVDFPASLPPALAQSSAARSIPLMLEQWAKEKHFRLN